MLKIIASLLAVAFSLIGCGSGQRDEINAVVTCRGCSADFIQESRQYVDEAVAATFAQTQIGPAPSVGELDYHLAADDVCPLPSSTGSDQAEIASYTVADEDGTRHICAFDRERGGLDDVAFRKFRYAYRAMVAWEEQRLGCETVGHPISYAVAQRAAGMIEDVCDPWVRRTAADGIIDDWCAAGLDDGKLERVLPTIATEADARGRRLTSREVAEVFRDVVGPEIWVSFASRGLTGE